MGLLKNKKAKTVRATRRQQRHKRSGGSGSVKFKETDRGLVKLSSKSSSLKKQGAKISSSVGKKGDKSITARQRIAQKKEEIKKQKQQKEEQEELEEDDAHDDPNVQNDYYFPTEKFDVTDEDDMILKQFNLHMDDNKKKKRRASYLGEAIFEKIEEKFEEKEQQEIQENILNDPRVQQVYGEIAELLSHYKSGKLPKAFIFIPVMDQWDRVLALTKPENWTPHALRKASKVFVSSLDPYRTQYFFETYLLPAIRKDIKENHKLHAQYYMALKEAMYKPGAFFKGIIFPLARGMNCSIREATIISSIVKKLSIPQLHASASIVILADMDYCGATQIFLKCLIEKKFSLPYKALLSIIEHFKRFEDTDLKMPVIWHQNLLSFSKIYGGIFDEMQKESLKQLVAKKGHKLINAEVLTAIEHKDKSQIINQNLNKSFAHGNMDSSFAIENPKLNTSIFDM